MRRRRRAYTLIELIVIVGIIGVLIGLLVPSIRSARLAAMRVQCQNNLRQVGLALHNYHDAHEVFPPGRLRSRVDGRGQCWSAYAQLLPFLEQDMIFSTINFQQNPEARPSAAYPANNTALTTTINTLTCPVDAHEPVPGQVGTLSYLLNTGNTYAISPRNPGRVPVTGVFFENSAVRFADLADGSSQTVFVSETIRSEPSTPSTWDGRGSHHAFVLTRGSDDEKAGPELTDPATQCSGEGLILLPAQGRSWAFAAPGVSLYNHVRPPNDPRVGCRGGLPYSDRTNADWDRLSHDIGAQSHHPSGVNALFGDASVRFVRNPVDPAIWSAVGSRAGGEAASVAEP